LAVSNLLFKEVEKHILHGTEQIDFHILHLMQTFPRDIEFRKQILAHSLSPTLRWT
jgi:hypothetical protein